MPLPSTLTMPAEGEKVTLLWRHVVRLVKKVNELTGKVADLEAQIAKKRAMDNTVAYVKCCTEDGECYLPVLVAGLPVRTVNERALVMAILETSTPPGKMVLS